MLSLAVAALPGLFNSGCNNSPTTRPVAKGANSAASNRQQPAAEAAVSQRCQTLLSSAIEMMRPENLGISAEPNAAVSTLNNWVRDCGKSRPADDPFLKDPALEKLITDEERAASNGELFDLQDVEHVRDCWLFKQARSSVVRAYDSDAARVVGLFDLSNRIVALAGKNEPVIPQSLHDITVIGKGTAEDRAWVFAELLRQMGIDAVILKPRVPAAAPGSSSAGSSSAATAAPKTADGAKTLASLTGAKSIEAGPRWLVGALVDKQIYLFDPTLGWPIPTRTDKAATPAVQSAATLAEVLADDGLLRKLDVSAEKPYPLHAADLKSLRVEVITSSRYWSPRVRRLETFLSGDRSATIYAPLGDMGNRPGLLSRAIAAGAGFWKKDDVVVWDYPDRQTAAANHPEQQAADLRDFRWLPFQGPVAAEFDKTGLKLIISAGSHKEMKSRIAQLQGDCAGAVRNYLLVQLDELPQAMPLPPEGQEAVRSRQAHPQEGSVAIPVPKEAFATNFRAAEDAKFWMGVCQLEQNMLEPAAETLDAYWRRYQEVGNWLPQAALLRGLVLAKAEKYGLAVQQINELLRRRPEDDPRRQTGELFAVRWRAARDAANSPNQEKAAPKSEPSVPPSAAASVQPPATPSPAKPGPVSSPPSTTASPSKAPSGPANPKTKTP
jgi:hypothetical protein